jgi:hypothetical protein
MKRCHKKRKICDYHTDNTYPGAYPEDGISCLWVHKKEHGKKKVYQYIASLVKGW